METMHKKHDPWNPDENDPWNPPYPLYVPSSGESYPEWYSQRATFFKTVRATNIIIPDRTPQSADFDLHGIYPRLVPILRNDSVPRFLRLFDTDGDCMTWGYIITPQTFNLMIVYNAVRCAKVALEGKAPELDGFRANPNCMNQYGYFPLHEAAERFSVEMIKLLLHHGASTNLRTAGAFVIEDLLPLHVAVEDTCLHKYLEESLPPNPEHPDYATKADANYIYKLIHLLCLPEMKIFLDTTRLLAGYTHNLVDEIWNYIKDGKLVQTAVLLLAAQAHLRLGSSCKRNGNSTVDGFGSIIDRITTHIMNLNVEMGQNQKELQHLMLPAMLLVNIVARAGKDLDSYIRKHREVPQAEVFERVSSILKAHDFLPPGESTSIGNLCPYKWWRVLDRKLPEKHGNMVATEAATGTPYLHPADEQAARNKLAKRWGRECTWRDFFPYWRSVLASRYPVKVYPHYAHEDVMAEFYAQKGVMDEFHNSGSNSIDEGSIPIRNSNVPLLARRIPQVTSGRGSRRLFGTVALTLLKVLKNS